MDPTTRFYSPTKGRMTFDHVVLDIVSVLEENPRLHYEVIVGTDSHSNYGVMDFVSAIIIHKVGKGGRYFWKRVRQPRIQSLHQKIWKEAMLSFDLAKALMGALQKQTPLDYDLEIHVDVGERGPTKELIDEVVGMIVGSGFAVKTKPDSYGASTVADKHT